MGFFRRKKKQERDHSEKSDHTLVEEIEVECSSSEDCYIKGLEYEQVELDKAIAYYEKGLEIDKTHVKTQSNLLKLYNEKRKQLLEEKNVNAALEYLDKIDYVMKQSKDSARGL